MVDSRVASQVSIFTSRQQRTSKVNPFPTPPRPISQTSRSSSSIYTSSRRQEEPRRVYPSTYDFVRNNSCYTLPPRLPRALFTNGSCCTLEHFPYLPRATEPSIHRVGPPRPTATAVHPTHHGIVLLICVPGNRTATPRLTAVVRTYVRTADVRADGGRRLLNAPMPPRAHRRRSTKLHGRGATLSEFRHKTFYGKKNAPFFKSPTGMKRSSAVACSPGHTANNTTPHRTSSPPQSLAGLRFFPASSLDALAL